MGLLSLTLPTIGQPNSTEDSKVRDALSAIQTEFNGNIELTNTAASLQELFIPTATVLPYASSVAPSGFLICDGAEVSRGTYSALFTKIDVLYGAGDGSTTFNLPDLQGRTIVGKGTHTSVDTLGETEGQAVANRTPFHGHGPGTMSILAIDDSVSAGSAGFDWDSARSGRGYISGYFSGRVGSASGALDTPSYQVLNYIIKT